MRVLSLFDGICCGHLALERAGIKIDSYDAYEIEKNAIKATETNFPDVVEHGDVTIEDFTKYKGKIDLLIGGSPCTNLSMAGNGQGLKGSQSKLFYEYARAIKEAQPKYFLLENVIMKKEWEDIITNILGVEPIEINSSLVSAQNRRRLYWTNIPNVTLPENKNITLEDILEDVEFPNPAAIRGRRLNKATIVGRRLDKNGHRKDTDKTIPITQCLEVRATNTDKSNCLTTVDKDNVLTPLSIGRHPDAFKNNLPFRYYTTKEMCRLQTVPDDFLNMIPDSAARKALGNGWTVDVIAHIFSFLPDEYKIPEVDT
jgi:DNA (cytosine-5)-methyltransferase 3A|uniref:DNA (cytosine-5-)-methyltransferase n=1 Tax=Bacteriophage sp. TaxID=38018 RepID=A0A8D9PE54_9VIRU|nr:MAG TPA: Cytosine specific methyltransferase [Bacteriophage sp.]